MASLIFNWKLVEAESTSYLELSRRTCGELVVFLPLHSKLDVGVLAVDITKER